jgi:hypothetical protein
VTAAAIKAIKERLARKNDKNDESERRKR